MTHPDHHAVIQAALADWWMTTDPTSPPDFTTAAEQTEMYLLSSGYTITPDTRQEPQMNRYPNTTTRTKAHIKAISDELKTTATSGDGSPAQLFTSGMLTGLATAVRILDGTRAEDALETITQQLSDILERQTEPDGDAPTKLEDSPPSPNETGPTVGATVEDPAPDGQRHQYAAAEEAAYTVSHIRDRELEQAEARQTAALFTARHWRQQALTRGWPVTAHALALVSADLNGELDPGELGIDDDQHEAFRAALNQPNQPPEPGADRQTAEKRLRAAAELLRNPMRGLTTPIDPELSLPLANWLDWEAETIPWTAWAPTNTSLDRALAARHPPENPMTEPATDHICSIRSTLDSHGNAACLMQWGRIETLLTPDTVLATARDLTTAATHAETDIALITALREDIHLDDQTLGGMLGAIRSRRLMQSAPTALRIAAVAGHNTGLPLVHISRGSMKGELSPDEARSMAMHWTETAVAAHIDVRLRYVLGEWDRLNVVEIEELFTLIQKAGGRG